jgi:cardiolipin synthase
MPPLLEKIRGFKRRRNQASAITPPAPSGNTKPDRRRLWVILVGGLVLGLGAFFWLTSARLLMEPIRIDYGPTDAAFANAIGPITGADFTEGNTVETLVNGDEFFPRMLEAIRGAKKTITLETYIWESGYISNLFIDALTERARAGVKVHALVDGMGALKFNASDRDRLLEAGVQFHKYGRERWWHVKPNINHRTHRKLLIVDGVIGFTGGMCIADSWLGDAHAKYLWRDTQVRITGPAVRQMQAVFTHNWLQTTAGLLIGEDYFPKLTETGRSFAHCFKSGPDEGAEAVRLAYLFAIASARRSIDIANAYFVPDDLAIDMLLEAMSRGVKVRIIIPAHNDSKFGRAASRSRYGKLIAGGAEFHLYQPAMYHAKTMVVDNVLLIIGSSNFDNRSFAINDEVTVGVLDPRIAKEHVRIIEDDIKHSKPLSREEFESRPIYIKALDHACGWFRSQL